MKILKSLKDFIFYGCTYYTAITVVMLIPVLANVSPVTDTVLTLVGAFLFIAASLTDMLDGKIARKYNLVTDFGKFIDPLADKFMVIASQITILVWALLNGQTTFALIFIAVVLLILLRELGVTSLRLVVAGNSGIVVAASWFGKIKTVTQVVAIELIILEPVILDLFGDWFARGYYPLSWFAMAAMLITTVASGIDYLKAYWPHINTNK